MKQGKGNYFFAPRIGEKYHEGFNGIRTLVVGTYHICYENCQFKDLCCDVDTVKEMDYKCPKCGSKKAIRVLLTLKEWWFIIKHPML